MRINKYHKSANKVRKTYVRKECISSAITIPQINKVYVRVTVLISFGPYRLMVRSNTNTYKSVRLAREMQHKK